MPKKLTDDLYVAGQISAAEVDELATQGFKSIVCNRPDGEVADQPGFDDIAAAAARAGLETRYVPIALGGVSDEEVAAFAAAIADLPKPVLAYCRSGARSTTAWERSRSAAGQ